MKYLILDFNGTVLDDVEVGLLAENNTIKHFKLNRGPLTMEEYLSIFTFPVKDYYAKVGFDWNVYSYEEVGAYWVDQYNLNKDKYSIYPGVRELIMDAKKKDYKVILLSASSLEMLKRQCRELGIYDYFDEILGIGDIYAGSKADIALQFIKDKDPKDCLMIGDTLHDLEVSDLMGVKCILVAQGHQAKDVLLSKTDLVYDHISEVKL